MGGDPADEGRGMTSIGGTITQAEGKAIIIDNFQSDGSGTIAFSKVADAANGYDKILDDGDGASGDSVRAIDISTETGAARALAVIDAALQDINTQRSELGAISNRLDHTISNLGNVVVNTEASQSRIEDADFASETGNLTKAQILSQAATAMLAQANASKQSVLSLLQG
jgi:flagellin